MSDIQAADHIVGRDRQAEIIDNSLGLAAEFAFVDDTEFILRKVADEKVLHDGHERQQLPLLINDTDAGVNGILRRGKVYLFTVDQNGTLVLMQVAVNDLQQGTLSGAVLAKKRQNFAAFSLKINVVQGADAGEALSDSPKFQ